MIFEELAAAGGDRHVLKFEKRLRHHLRTSDECVLRARSREAPIRLMLVRRQAEKKARHGGDPPRIEQIFAAVSDDVAECRRRRLDAEAEKAKRRFEDHHAGHVENRREQHRRQEQRQQQCQDDAEIRRSADLGGTGHIRVVARS